MPQPISCQSAGPSCICLAESVVWSQHCPGSLAGVRPTPNRGDAGHQSAQAWSEPLTHLGVVEGPKSDPAFLALMDAIKDMRELGPAEQAWEHVCELASAPAWGVTGKIALDASQNQLPWTSRGRPGIFLPHACPNTRGQLSCPKSMGAHSGARPGCEGLATVDMRESLELLHSSPDLDKSVLRVTLNGTFFTNDALKHVCGALDGVIHRVWDCPFFHAVRSACTPEDLARVDTEAPCLQAHGWVQEVRAKKLFLQALQMVLDTLFVYESCHLHTLELDLFVDGACEHPTDPAVRLASWAVHLVQVTDQAEESLPLAGGVVSGLVQTAARAELLAMVSAVYFAATNNRDARIWCDKQNVVHKTRLMWQQQITP